MAHESFQQELRERGKLVDLDVLSREQVQDILHAYEACPLGFAPEFPDLSYNNRNRILGGIADSNLEPVVALRVIRDLYVPDLLTQQVICDVLREIRGLTLPQAAPLLRTVCLRSYPKARVFVARVIVHFMERSPEDARNLLVEWSTDPDHEIREVVALYYRYAKLGNRYDIEDIRLLDLLSQDEFSSVRRHVALAIREYLSKPIDEAFGVAERLSHDNRWETAALAIESVGFAGPVFIRNALRLLRSFLMNENKSISRRAIRGLRKLAVSHPRRTFNYYREIVRERSWMDVDVLHTVLQSLRDLFHRSPYQALPLIRELALDEDENVSTLANALLEELGIHDFQRVVSAKDRRRG